MFASLRICTNISPHQWVGLQSDNAVPDAQGLAYLMALVPISGFERAPEKGITQ